MTKKLPREQLQRKPAVDDTPELREEICGRMAEGETLHQICNDPNKDDHLPDYRTVMRWLHDPRDRHREFRLQFIRAARAYTFLWLDWAEQAMLDNEAGWMWSNKKECWVPDNYAIQHLRVLGEHARWRAKAILSDIFGDKLAIDVDDEREPQGPRIDWTKLSESALKEVQAAMYYPDEDRREEKVVGEQSADNSRD